MITIRTAEDFARVLSEPPDPELHALLRAQAERLAEYADFTFEELAEIFIVQPHDTLADIEHGSGVRLVADGDFLMPPELIQQHGLWIEAIFVLSDDGFGLVLYIKEARDTDPELLALCLRHFRQHKSAG